MTGIRALLGLCIAMGVLIVAGTTTLVAVVVHRLTHGHPTATAATGRAEAGSTTDAMPARATLGEPPGSRIVGVVRGDDRSLILQLSGGGRPDRIVVWDVPGARALQTITVGTAPAS